MLFKIGGLKTAQLFTGKHLRWSLLLKTCRPSALNFIEKETPTREFSCDYWEFSKKNFLYRTAPVAASKVLPNHCCVNETYTPTIRHKKVIVLSL